MSIVICDNVATRTKIRQIKFKIPITVDLSNYDLPERVIEVINDNNYLSLFVESSKYNKPNRNGNRLSRTAKGSYLETKLTEGGFTATFDYGEYEIIKLLKQIAVNSFRFKEYITVLDYVGIEYSDSEFTTRIGVISEIQHTGSFDGDPVIVNGVEKQYKFVEGGFTISFSEDRMYYV
jgi:hypothetical protein